MKDTVPGADDGVTIAVSITLLPNDAVVTEVVGAEPSAAHSVFVKGAAVTERVFAPEVLVAVVKSAAVVGVKIAVRELGAAAAANGNAAVV